MAKAINWAWVERKWSTNQLSNVQIANLHFEEFGVSLSEAAIRKKAKDEGWKRDLAGDVRRETHERLVRDGCEARTSDREVIDEAADRAVQVVRSHRSDIRTTRDLVSRLTGLIAKKIDVCEARCEEPKSIVAQIDGEKAREVDTGTVLDLANALARVSMSLGKLVVLERQAFNISTDPAKAGTDEEELSEQLVLAAADVIKQSRG